MTLGDTQVAEALLGPGAAPAARDAGPATRRQGWLFHPLIDVFCLGGGSLLALMVLALVVPTQGLQVEIAIWALAAAHVVNHPHFAHSYQIFYSGFRGKAFGETFPPGLRRRYLFAGLAVPLLLAGFFAACVLAGDAQAIGYAGNAMVFLVGWHYAKQGYGMAMLDAVLKRRFFTAGEKRLLLWNAYLCWLLSWVLANHYASVVNMWGLAYYTFALPDWLLGLFYAAAGGSSGATLWMLLRKGRAEAWRLPWNGLLAYGTTSTPGSSSCGSTRCSW